MRGKKGASGGYLLVGLGTVLLVFASLGGWMGDANQPARIGIHSGLAIGGLVLLLMHVLRWARENPRRLAARVEFLELSRQPASEALDALMEAEGSGAVLDIREAMNLAAALVKPARNRLRVVEHVIVGGDAVSRRISIQYRGPLVPSREAKDTAGTGQRSVFVPIARRFKGELMDDFSCSTGTGEAISVLSHSDTAELLTRIAWTLLREALESRSLRPDELLKLQRDVAAALLQPSLEAEAAIRRVKKQFPVGAAESDQYISLMGLLTALKDRHPLIAAVPASSLSVDDGAFSVLLKYEYSHPLPDAMPPQGHDRWYGVSMLLRKLALTRGLQLSFRARKAKSSDSYHMRVTAPPGYHVADQLLVDASSVKAIAAAKGAQLESPYVQLAPARYQQSAHLYTRAFDTAEKTEPVLVVRIAEDLPGSLGRAVATAGTVAVTVLIVGVLMNGKSWDPERVDLLPFILAIPALMAAWAGFAVRGPRAFGSLVAKVSIFATTVLSLASAALYLAQEDGHLNFLKADSWTWLGVRDSFWSLLLLLSLLNTMWTGMTLAVRAVRRHDALNSDVAAG